MLAESWASSGDLKQWTFRIRRGVKFHESPAFKEAEHTRQVTADDVVFSYHRFAKGFGSFVFAGLVDGFDEYAAGKAQRVSGFSAPDPATFVVRLTRPDPAFLYRITSPYLGIMPREAVEGTPNAWGVTSAIGTGPFRLLSRAPTEVMLERNSLYWRSVPGNVARVVFRVEKNAQLRMTQLDQGSYDVAQLPFAFVPRYVSGGQLRPEFRDRLGLYIARTFNVHYLGIDNLQIRDTDLRRAIAKAIDKRAIVEGLLHGLATTATSPVPPGLQGFEAPPEISATVRPATPSAGRTARPVLRLMASTSGSDEQVAQVIQNDLKQAGIETRIELADFNTLISRIFSKDRPELFLAQSEWIFSSPEPIMDVYDSRRFPNPNMFGYSNSRIDAEIESLRSLSDRSLLNARCREIASTANEEAPAVWLYHEHSPYLLRAGVQGFAVNGHQHWLLANVSVSNK